MISDHVLACFYIQNCNYERIIIFSETNNMYQLLILKKPNP